MGDGSRAILYMSIICRARFHVGRIYVTLPTISMVLDPLYGVSYALISTMNDNGIKIEVCGARYFDKTPVL
jgi:hypothetical protein